MCATTYWTIGSNSQLADYLMQKTTKPIVVH